MDLEAEPPGPELNSPPPRRGKEMRCLHCDTPSEKYYVLICKNSVPVEKYHAREICENTHNVSKWWVL